MKFIKYLACVVLMTSSVATLTSCKDDDDYGTPPRLFSPVVKVTSSSNSLMCQWQGIKGATNYELTLLKASTLTDEDGNPIFNEIATVETSLSRYVFDDLDWDDRYRVDIKAVGNDIESHTYQGEAITISYPTKLKSIANVIDAGVRIEWNNDDNGMTDVAYFNIFTRNADGTMTPWHRGDASQEPETLADEPAEGDDDSTETPGETVEYYYTVSQDDRANSYCDIYGLVSGTDYRAVAYSAEGEYRGRRDFSTKEAEVYEQPELIFDLRVNEMDTVKNEFFSTLPENATIVLAGGKRYIFVDDLITKSVKFTTGLSLSGKAIISTNGFKMSGNVGTVEFDNVELTCLPSDNNLDKNFGGRYIFGDGALYTVDKLIFENVDINYMRGGFRLRTTGQTCNSIELNNCNINYIADYALCQAEAEGTLVGTFKLTNSTVTNTKRVLRVNKSTAAFDNVIIENVTFDKVGDAADIFDMGNKDTQSPNLNFKISNCIFGTAFSTAKGIRTNKNAIVGFSNVFVASDFQWSVKEGKIEDEFPSYDTMTLSTSDIWIAPASLDFTLKSAKLICSEAGDPRWHVVE